MAINLRAILTLEDRFSRQLAAANRAIENTNTRMHRVDNSIGSMRRQLSGASRSFREFGNMGKVSVLGINSSLLTLMATMGSVRLLASGLSQIVKNAAEYEQSTVLITALFDDEKASKSYMDMVDRVATESPILDSSTMLSNSKSFLAITKDMDQLEKAWGVAEKLSITDPIQGLEGAVFAMRELASGDLISMAERFEIPKDVLREFKDLSFEEQLNGLTKYLDGIGMTTEAVEKMGATTASQFIKLKEKVNIMFRDMGKSTNSKLGEAMATINQMIEDGKFDGAIKAADKALGDFATDVANFAATADWDKIAQDIETAFNKINEAIQWAVENWNTIKQAVMYALYAFLAFRAVTFIVTLFTAIGMVVQFLSKTLLFLRTVFNILRLSMLMFPGAWIVIAVLAVIAIFILLYQKCDWFREFWDETWDKAVETAEWAVNNIIDGINWLIEKINSIPGIEIDTVGGVDFNGDGKQKGANKTTKKASKKGKSHSGGLSRVPYDGYSATLHRGERVLTRAEANSYEGGGNNSSSISISFAGANFSVRSESDIEAIASVLATKITQSINKGA